MTLRADPIISILVLVGLIMVLGGGQAGEGNCSGSCVICIKQNIICGQEALNDE